MNQHPDTKLVVLPMPLYSGSSMTQHLCFQAPSTPTEPTYTLSLANQELMKLCQQWRLSQDFST